MDDGLTKERSGVALSSETSGRPLVSSTIESVRRGGSAAIVGAASQAFGLLQFALLLVYSGGGRESDAYIYLASVGMLPTQIVLLGVIFPLLIRSWDFGQTQTRSIVALSIVSSLCLTAGGYVFYVVTDQNFRGVSTIAILVGINCAAQSWAWFMALRSAAEGDARRLSAVTLMPSVMACVLLGLVIDRSPLVKATMMSAGVLAGTLMYVVLLISLNLRKAAVLRATPHGRHAKDRDQRESPERTNGRGEALWFLLKSGSGYGAGVALQTMTAVLPPSSLTIVGIISKCVSGVTTVVSNSLLPVLINRSSGKEKAAVGYCYVVILSGFFVGVVLALMSVFTGIPRLVTAWLLIGVAWLVAANVSATVQRMAVRFHEASVSSVSVLVSFIVPLITLAILLTHELDVWKILAAFVFLDLLVAVGVSWTVQMRKLALILLAVVVSCLLAAFWAQG